MQFRVKNDSPKPLDIGAEPFGHYVTIAPSETVVMHADEVEDITVGERQIAFWVKSSAKLTAGETVLFDY